MYIQCSDSKSTDCQRVTGKKKQKKNAFSRKRFDFECDHNGNSCVLVTVSEVYRGPSGFRKTM